MFRFLGFVSICSIILLGACSPERRLARDYIKHHSGNGIMIIPLFELYKDNLTISYDTNKTYSPDQFDSIAWVQSCFIKHVSDSVFLTLFTNSLIDELSSEGFDVYVDGSSDVFLSLPDPKWMVQIAQLQLDEDHRIDSRQEYSVETGESYSENFRVNQVSLKSWFDVSRTNTGHKQILYLEGYVQDDFHLGVDFDLMEGSLGIMDNRDSIAMDDVYHMADELGRKHAALLFDYFMNDYIRENLPSGIINREYFHYNLKTRSLKRGLEERFDVIN
jgi:hypothetical protein